MNQQKPNLPKTLWILLLAALLFAAIPASAQTPDGETPAEETVCEDEPNQLRGLCNSYCEAMDCDSGANASEEACASVLANYRKKSGGADPPCFNSEICDGIDNDEDGEIDEGFDLDGDGVARCCTNGKLFVTLDTTLHAIIGYLSNGDGTFTREPFPIAESATEEVRFSAVGDFNGDDNFDVVWNGRDTRDRFLAVCEGGEWQSIPTGTWTYGYNGGADVDLDGRTDLVGWDMACCFMSGPVLGPGVPALGLTALGIGFGDFTEVYGTFDPSIVLGQWLARRTYNLEDADGDGYPDLIFLHYANGSASTSFVYFAAGNGDGTFQPPGLIGTVATNGPQPQNASDMGDIDGDGCSDWVGGPDDDGDRGAVFAMFGNCAGGYSPPVEIVDACNGCAGSGNSPGSGQSRLFDWDCDDDLDLLTSRNVTSGVTATIEYWENDGSGNFSGPTLVVPTMDLRSNGFATPLRN